MKALILNDTGRVFRLGDDLVLTASGASAAGWQANIMTTANAQLLDVVNPPQGLREGWLYANGSYTAPPLTPDEVDAARVAAIDGVIAGDTTIAALKGMTSAEFDAWWTANVTTLAQANAVLKRIARVVIRRVL